MPARKAVRPILLIALLVALLTSAAPSAHAAQPCDLAFSLLAERKPQQALAKAAEGGAAFATSSTEKRVCARASELATAQIRDAGTAAQAAEAAFTARNYDAARTSAQQALALDAENSSARDTTAKLDALPVGTNWVRLADTWRTSVDTYLVPAGILALTVLAAFAILWILGRLVALVWPIQLTRHPTRVASRTLFRIGMASASLAAIGSVVSLSVWAPGARGPASAHTAVALVTIVLAVVGAGLIGWVKAHDLRLTVGPSSQKAGDAASTGRVLALLEQMGGGSPQGLERAYGTDAQGLNDAVSGLALPATAGTLAKIIGAGVTLVAGRTPWQVLVDASEGVSSVAVLRNGRTAGSLVIRDEELTITGVEGKLPVEPFVAAYVLSVLAVYYKGFEGMCGATHWRSIGLQYLASTHRGRKQADAVRLLAEAVNLDPANMLAQVNLASRCWRTAADAETLGFYLDWIDEHMRTMSADPDRLWGPAKEGYRDLRLRTHLTRSVVAINLYFALADNPGRQPGARTRAEIAVAEMCLAVDAAGRDEGPRTTARPRRMTYQAWLDKLRARAAANVREFDVARIAGLVTEREPHGHPLGVLHDGPSPLGPVAGQRSWDELPLAPITHYSAACALLAPVGGLVPQGAGGSGPGTWDPKGIDHLRQARVLPEIVEWMPKDPQLKVFWNEMGALTFPREPLASLLELAIFKPYAQQLTRNGLTSASSIASLQPEALAAYTVAGEETRRAMVDAALLVTTVTGSRLTGLALDIVAALIEQDLARMPLLSRMSRCARSRLAHDLSESLRGVRRESPEEDLTPQLTAWLGSLRR